MAWSSSNAYPGNWSIPGEQRPEMEQPFYTPNVFENTSTAILMASHFHTHPVCSTCLQGLDHASTTANLSNWHDFDGMNHDLARPSVTSTSQYEVPSSSLQTTLPLMGEICLAQNNCTKDLEGGSSSHRGKKAE